MTAIAGIVCDGKVWIGGDSAGTNYLFKMETRTDPKVFVNGEFVFGYTSSFRMGQLLEHEFTPPTPHEGDDGVAYMVKRFIPAVKATLKSGGYQKTSEGQDEGGTFLVGYRGTLYQVYSDYQVARVRQGYQACGCGETLILGSLPATDRYDISPKDRIIMALEAAEQFSAGVRGPFTVLCK